MNQFLEELFALHLPEIEVSDELRQTLLNSCHDSQYKCLSQGCGKRLPLDTLCSHVKIQIKVYTHHKTYFHVLIHRVTLKLWNLPGCQWQISSM